MEFLSTLSDSSVWLEHKADTFGVAGSNPVPTTLFFFMEKQIRLTIELVPSTCWYTNVRSHVSEFTWDIIRKKCYRLANHKCEICGSTGKEQGYNHNVECHEIWYYDDVNHKQILTGLIALCPYCHKTKHVGLAQINGEKEIVINQLMKVNGMSREEAIKYITESFSIWKKRSEFKWETDITYIKKYIND